MRNRIVRQISTKPYPELKVDFMVAKNNNNPALALEKAGLLKQSFNNSKDMHTQMEAIKKDLKSDIRTGLMWSTGHGVVVMAYLSIWDFQTHSLIAFSLNSCALASRLVATYLDYKLLKGVTPFNAFNDEKDWLIKEIDTIPMTPSRSPISRLDEKLEKVLEEKKTNKLS